MKDNFDRLRKKTGIDRLDDTQRKRLFHEFVEHGGEIIDEKKQGEKLPPEKPRDREAVRQAARVEKRIKLPAQKPPAVRQKSRPRIRKKSKPFTGIKVYVKGLFSKVFAVNGKFSDRFVRFFGGEAKNHFLDLNLTVSSFLDGKSSIVREIKKASTGESSTFYELIIRLRTLYDDKEFSSIEKAVGRKSIPVGPYIEIFKSFFKKMYILGQFTDLSKFYLQKAVGIQQSTGTRTPEDAEVTKGGLKNDVDVILIDILGKFHAIVCRMYRVYYPLFSQELDDLLGITEQDKIGYITHIERKKRAEELKRIKEYLKGKQEEAHEKVAEEVAIPRHIQRGLPILQKTIEEFERQTYGEDAIFSLFHPADKMYRSAVFMEIFEKEYSFVLTTGKIVFTIDYREQKKIDIKEDLNHAYLLFSEARHEVKDYIDILKEYRKADENLRLTVLQKSSILESLNKKRSIASRNARYRIAEAMKAIQNTLSVVIDDYNSSKRLLENAEESLHFNEKIDGPKKLNNKKVIEAVVDVFLFASTCAFLLTYGELSGSGLTTENPALKKQPTGSS